ncbi:MAG: acyltransferase family protein, partial [Planctomycetota bacterium]
MNHRDYLDRRTFGSLDGLRAASILAVIWHHATQRGIFSLPMADRGFLGVDMFFVLSGFLIVTLLLREFDRNGRISLRNFYARRTLRIFPVYYAVLGALTLLYLWKPEAGSASTFFAELPFYATYTSNWVDTTVLALTWSLATEEQFYLFWPPVERYLKPLAVPILLVVIGISQLVNFGFFDSQLANIFGDDASILPILQVTFTPICFGVLLARLLHSPQGYLRLARFCG